MRRAIGVAAALLSLAVAGSAVAAPVFVVNGRGWGHGIGLPQYGAYGYAREEGKTYDWILSHFYPGTNKVVTPPQEVRVLLADDRSSLTVGSDSAFRATDASNRSFDLKAGDYHLGPKLQLTIDGKTETLVSPVRFTRGSSLLELGGNAYRGSLVVISPGKTLDAVNHVGLEQYLYGVVPWEMPPSWSPEALKAQAVAARSYALAVRKTTGSFDLYPDTRSQVYGGVRAEDRRTTAAIDATAGEILMHGGRVAVTYFHSTSGGRTASVEHEWGSRPIPYLVSVADPYSRISPHHRWGPLVYTGRQLASRLGSRVPADIEDVTVARNGSGRAASITVTGRAGRAVVSAATVRALLDLRSTWFSVGVLSVTPAERRIVFGERVELNGIARGLRRPVLQRKAWRGSWGRVTAVDSRAGGAFSVSVRPRTSTAYRVVAGDVTGLPVRVAVAAKVTVGELESRNELRGRVRPRVAGASVAVQKSEGGRWVTIATTETTAGGEFRAAVTLEPGLYRAVARVGRGLLPGRTPALRIVSG